MYAHTSTGNPHLYVLIRNSPLAVELASSGCEPTARRSAGDHRYDARGLSSKSDHTIYTLALVYLLKVPSLYRKVCPIAVCTSVC